MTRIFNKNNATNILYMTIAAHAESMSKHLRLDMSVYLKNKTNLLHGYR